MSQTPPEGSTVLIVDDDDRLRERMATAFRTRGYDTWEASSATDALTRWDEHPAEFAVIDLRMPGPSGLELLEQLRAKNGDLQAVILTGYGSIATAVDAMRLGAVNFLQKPADADMVLAAFARGAGPPLAPAPDYEPPSLARAEWEHICRVLDDCGGNISKAARKLGMHRRTLQRKLQTYPPRT